MEFVAGKDLHQILSKEWPLPESRVVRIIGQVLSALSDAHNASIIHRDLKPENIMVEQRRGEPDFVKVLDFGIAKMLDSNDEGPALTRAGFVCGTPEYMSPEQARGAQLDHRSDLYAVGVILYQLMAGMLPFDSDTAVGFATKHLTEEPQPPSRRRPEAKISIGMERLIMKTLSKDPNDRPESADAFRAELLAVDKARRQAAQDQAPQRARGMSSPVLAPLPRKATPIDQQETSIHNKPSAWDANEATVQATVRAYPERRSKPHPVLPRPEKSVKMAPVVVPTETDRAVVQAGNPLALKIGTVVLAVIALGLGGYYIYSGRADGDQVVVHPNAPIPNKAPLHERQIPVEKRDVEGAAKLTREGDEAHLRGDFSKAATFYRAAFELDTNPELSLKLGEVLYRSGHADEAKLWWQRHLKDQSQSKARRYIQETLGELTP
jgi:serine/threonine-protein kinase